METRTAMHLAASEGDRTSLLADARSYEAENAKSGERPICEDNLPQALPTQIDPAELQYVQDSQCDFGIIKLMRWRGQDVQVRIMDRRVDSNSPQSDCELTKELSLLIKLRHPNIVQFLGAVRIKSSEPVVLVTEYLPKRNLLELLRESKKGRIPQNEAMKYALDIARGMNYLHQHSPETVVHCDLNPKNLLRDDFGHLKVAGLHLSKIDWICKYGVNNLTNQQFMRSHNLEFARYRAPELTPANPTSSDAKVDVFSFGVIVREMFEGRILASRRAQGQAASKLYPPYMERMIQKCCHRYPGNRPSFDTIIERLEQIEDAMRNPTLSSAMQSVVYKVSTMRQFCIRPAPCGLQRRLRRSRSLTSVTALCGSESD